MKLFFECVEECCEWRELSVYCLLIHLQHSSAIFCIMRVKSSSLDASHVFSLDFVLGVVAECISIFRLQFMSSHGALILKYIDRSLRCFIVYWFSWRLKPLSSKCLKSTALKYQHNLYWTYIFQIFRARLKFVVHTLSLFLYMKVCASWLSKVLPETSYEAMICGYEM